MPSGPDLKLTKVLPATNNALFLLTSRSSGKLWLLKLVVEQTYSSRWLLQRNGVFFSRLSAQGCDWLLPAYPWVYSSDWRGVHAELTKHIFNFPPRWNEPPFPRVRPDYDPKKGAMDGCVLAAYLSPWVPGPDLLDWLVAEAQQTSELRVLRLMLQMTEAVAALHRAGLVHGDIKLTNWVVPRHPLEHIKLIDWESGYVRSEGIQQNQMVFCPGRNTQACIGYIRYAAGDGFLADATALGLDLYSLASNMPLYSKGQCPLTWRAGRNLSSSTRDKKHPAHTAPNAFVSPITGLDLSDGLLREGCPNTLDLFPAKFFLSALWAEASDDRRVSLVPILQAVLGALQVLLGSAARFGQLPRPDSPAQAAAGLLRDAYDRLRMFFSESRPQVVFVPQKKPRPRLTGPKPASWAQIVAGAKSGVTKTLVKEKNNQDY